MYDTTATRRRVLSTVGVGIVGSLCATGSVTADSHGRTFTADLSGEPLGIDTNASGTATMTVGEDDARYELRVDCLRNGTEVTLEYDGMAVATLELDGPVTEGLVRDETIAEGTVSGDDLDGIPVDEAETALENGEVTVVVHTRQNPDGEIGGQFAPETDGEPDMDDGEDGESDQDEDEDTRGDDLSITDMESLFEGETNVARIVVENTGDEGIDLTGWRIETGINTYEFPDGTVLEPGESHGATDTGAGFFLEADPSRGPNEIQLIDDDGGVVLTETYETDPEATHVGVVRVVDENGDPVEGEPVEISPQGIDYSQEETDEDGEIVLQLSGAPSDAHIRYLRVRDTEETFGIARGRVVKEFTVSDDGVVDVTSYRPNVDEDDENEDTESAEMSLQSIVSLVQSLFA